MVLLASLFTSEQAAQAAECGLELVLALDVSTSVAPNEFDLQSDGLADAFRDPEVAESITWTSGDVMATVTQWSGPEAQFQTVPWTHLTDAASADAFADAIENQERIYKTSYTAIGEALVHAESLGATNPLRCKRRVIDLSGDGSSNLGRPALPVAEAAKGVTINGLVIQGAWPDPVDFYLNNVVRGKGAFLEIAANFADYARAIRRKLLRELTPNMAAR